MHIALETSWTFRIWLRTSIPPVGCQQMSFKLKSPKIIALWCTESMASIEWNGSFASSIETLGERYIIIQQTPDLLSNTVSNSHDFGGRTAGLILLTEKQLLRCKCTPPPHLLARHFANWYYKTWPYHLPILRSHYMQYTFWQWFQTWNLQFVYSFECTIKKVL